MVNYWIFNIKGRKDSLGRKRKSDEIYRILMDDEVWGIGKNTPNRKRIKKGDKVIFYKTQPSGKKFLGFATLNSEIYPYEGQGNYSEDTSRIILKDWDYIIKLKDIVEFEEPILIEPLLESLEVIKNKSNWNSYIQGGVVYISKKDFEIILGNSPAQILLEDLDLGSYQGGIEEGKKKIITHYFRERNKKIIDLAKSKYLVNHGKLVCEICGFCFEEKYGQRGKDYIEGHHKKPLSQMKEGEKTFVEDIILLCSNCHKMIHRRMDDFSTEDLKEIISSD